MDMLKEVMSLGAPDLPDFLKKRPKRSTMLVSLEEVDSNTIMVTEQKKKPAEHITAGYSEDSLVLEAGNGLPPAEIFRKIIPIDTKEMLQAGRVLISKAREKTAVQGHNVMGRGVGTMGNFGQAMEGLGIENEIVVLREGTDFLVKSLIEFSGTADKLIAQCKCKVLDDGEYNECTVLLYEKEIHVNATPLRLSNINCEDEESTISLITDTVRFKIKMSSSNEKSEWVNLINNGIRMCTRSYIPDHQEASTISSRSPHLHDSKIVGWLDELHESIAMDRLERAVECVDRVRYDGNKDLGISERFVELTRLLEERLLAKIKDNFMDSRVVARAAHLLQGMNRSVEARDCLLSAHTYRISSMLLLAAGGSISGRSPLSPILTSQLMFKALTSSAKVYKEAFPETIMGSGLLVWLEVHVMQLRQYLERTSKDKEDYFYLLKCAREESEVLKRAGYDLDFVLLK